jgi:TetR/AcrR family transcriptional repressor of nem operon
VSARTDTRERIVESARTLFWEQGYTATGIAQILKKADANSGSLYYFFPTKEDLLLAVLERYKELLWPMVIEPVYSRVTDPIERIFGVLDVYRQLLLATDCHAGCPIGNLALEVGSSHPMARGLIAENFSGWAKAIRESLDACDRLPAEVDRHALSQFVLITMEGAVMLTKSYRDIAVFDAAIQQLRDYFERLLSDGSDWSTPKRQ